MLNILSTIKQQKNENNANLDQGLDTVYKWQQWLFGDSSPGCLRFSLACLQRH